MIFLEGLKKIFYRRFLAISGTKDISFALRKRKKSSLFLPDGYVVGYT